MTKQDNLNKLCAITAVADRLPEGVDVIDNNIDSDGLKIHLSRPDEGSIAEAFGGEVAEVPYGRASMKRYINVCGVEIFWLTDRAAGGTQVS